MYLYNYQLSFFLFFHILWVHLLLLRTGHCGGYLNLNYQWLWSYNSSFFFGSQASLLEKVRKTSLSLPLTLFLSIHKHTHTFKYIYFVLLPHPQRMDAPRAGIEPASQQGPKPLQWQHLILNLLHYKRTPQIYFLCYLYKVGGRQVIPFNSFLFKGTNNTIYWMPDYA